MEEFMLEVYEDPRVAEKNADFIFRVTKKPLSYSRSPSPHDRTGRSYRGAKTCAPQVRGKFKDLKGYRDTNVLSRHPDFRGYGRGRGLFTRGRGRGSNALSRMVDFGMKTINVDGGHEDNINNSVSMPPFVKKGSIQRCTLG
jgi:hypothetical protein